MSGSNIEKGAVVVHVERITYGGKPREIRRATIVRETRTQWVDDNGNHWRKSDGALVPQYCSHRSIMSIVDFEAQKEKP